MKNKLLLTMLFTSFLLASCENSNQNNEENNPEHTINDNYSINEQENANYEASRTINDEGNKNPKQRLSYQEYIEQNGMTELEMPRIQENNTQGNMSENEKKDYSGDNAVDDTNSLLATYSTNLLDNSDARVNNIEIVCDRLNDYILKPSETFSYNDVTGPFGEDDGFEKATILLKNGEHAKGYGGGVCQLSSTLYNVVKNIENVEITERHHHSVPVSYVPKNEDATVSLQSNLDFKFVNNNQYPIKFKSTCENNKVTVWAYKVG